MSRYAQSCGTYGGGFGGGFGQGSNCICSFPTLILLILVVLQFGKKNKWGSDDDYEDKCSGGNKQISNGILFIIAFFFLSCAGCGKGGY